ncbi:MAG: hypothetical protein M3022_05105 [Actinomycetota bacterium]|nr:hypothetical protein [Actinomycetota bacterium]
MTLQARGSISAEEAVLRLQDAGIAAGVVPAGRALDHPENVLRLSPDPGATTADIARIREVLASTVS